MSSSKQMRQNPLEKVVGRMMGGSTAEGDQAPTSSSAGSTAAPPTAVQTSSYAI